MASVYLRRDDKLLLLFRQGNSIVSNLWIGSAGGHFEEAELRDARTCVLRELFEELSIREDSLGDLSLRYVTIRYANNELRQNYYFFANLRDGIDDNLSSNEGKLQWFPLDAISELEMPHSAKYVMKHYSKEGRFSDKMYTGVTNAENVSFVELPES